MPPPSPSVAPPKSPTSAPLARGLVGQDGSLSTRFGKYRLIAHLGKGGMADVFLAVADGLAGFTKLSVVKVLRETARESSDFVTMFVDEARIASRLNHPNVVQTHEVGQVDGTYYLTMEYLDGQPFHRVLYRATRGKGAISTDFLLAVLMDTLRGLHYAHELADYDGTPMNIVHRDVTPQNVFITYEGHVKVVDFGIAKARGRTSETRSGTIKGKLRYMAPEQVSGVDVDRRADIFAVGVMLYDGLAERRMWDEVSEEVVIIHRLFAKDYPRSPRASRESIPEELDRICQKALAPEVADRYATAEEMRADIEQYLMDAGRLVEARRSLASVVNALFEGERSAIRKTIEAKLAEAPDEPSELLELDAVGEGDATVPDTHPPPAAASAGATTQPGVSAGDSSPRRGLLIAGIVAIGLVVAAAVFVARRPAPQPVVTAPPPVSAAPSSLAAARPKVRVSLRVVPPQGVLTLDGLRRSVPFDATLDSDSEPHKVHVEAPGFEPQDEVISFESDLDRTFQLSAVPEPVPTTGTASHKTRPRPRGTSAAAGTASAATTASASTAPVDTAGTKTEEVIQRKRRAIDLDDPYAKKDAQKAP